jgi:hypothetical protein
MAASGSIISFSHPGFRPYVSALGQLALAWNELHFILGLLYCSTMGVRVGVPVSQHLAVWYALKTDRAQRDILLAAATSSRLQDAPNAPNTIIADIEWISNRANVVEDARNNAIHSPLWGVKYHNETIEISPRPSAVAQGHVRARRLAGIQDLLAEFRWCRNASLCLAEYAFAAHISIFRGFAIPWPNRPVWPTRQVTSARKRRRQEPPKSSPRRPLSSPT